MKTCSCGGRAPGNVQGEPHPEDSISSVPAATKPEENSTDTSSDFVTLLFMLMYSFGIGVQTTAYVLSQLGLAAGCALWIFTFWVTLHGMHMLFKASHILRFRTNIYPLNYPETVEWALKIGHLATKKVARVSWWLTEVCLRAAQIGLCCIYFVYCAQCIQIGLHEYITLSVRQSMAMLLPVFLVFSCIKHRSAPLLFCSFALALALTGFGITLWNIASGHQASSEDISRRLDISWVELPIAIGFLLFIQEAVPLTFIIENRMKNSQEFLGCSKVMNTAIILGSCMGFGLGFYGYLLHGQDSKLIILYNFVESNLLGKIALSLVSLGSFFSFQSTLCNITNELWKYLEERAIIKNRKIMSQLFIRALFILAIFTFSSAFPDLSLLIPLVGAGLYSVLVLILPSLLHALTYVYRGNRPLYYLTLCKDGCLFIFGAYVCIGGIYLSFYKTVAFYST